VAKAIELIATRRGCAVLEDHPRYDVLFRGKLYSTLYFNLRGYVGNLPAPYPDKPGRASLSIGERSIGAYRKEVARLNREWAARPGPGLPACGATHCPGCVNCGRGQSNR